MSVGPQDAAMGPSGPGRRMGFMVIVCVALVNAAAYAFDLYQAIWWTDRAVHVVTTFAVTLWSALYVFRQSVRREDKAQAVIIFASIGLAIGALWEIAEWGLDKVSSEDIIKGKNDTIIDLIMDAIGAILGAAFGFVISQPRWRGQVVSRPASSTSVRGASRGDQASGATQAGGLQSERRGCDDVLTSDERF